MDTAALSALAGVVIGGFAICVACVVWLWKQTFGFGGAVLTAVGVVLVGLSVYQSVNVDVGPSGFKVGIIAFDAKPSAQGGVVGSKSIPIEGPVQIGFWTPSAATKNAPGIKQWEIMETDKKLDEFGDALVKAKIITGYRRYDVIGQGSFGLRQAGAWWVSTNTSSGFKLTEFLKAYGDFWHPGDNSVYMEVQPVSRSGYSNAPR